jgi:glycine cleavage system H protein
MSNIPDDLLYTKDDEWLRMDEDEGFVGLTDYAQDALSDIVYVELPEEGDSFDAGDAFGVIESVKAAADLYMPVSGEITAVNEDLPDMPEVTNSDPYGEGWLVKIKVNEVSSLEDLMDASAYRVYCDQRA